MRLKVLVATAILVFSASAASARPGCAYGNNRLGSENYSRGINARAPSRAIMNPCSSMYHFGANLRRQEKRRYPGAIVRH